MKKFRKLLRVLRLVFLITIATLGIGLSGGIPIIPVYKRNDRDEVKIELVEPRDQDLDRDIPEVKID